MTQVGECALLAAPITMAAAPMGGVYVLDAGMRKVYHFADGRLVWSWGTVDQGPGEILSVRAMDADPETGGVVLVDSRNRRMILLSSDGSLLRETPIEASSPLIPTVAALGGGLGYVISTYTVAFPLMHFGKNGDSARSIPAPWDGLVSKNAIQVMGSVFATNGGRWGYAPTTGDRWFVYPSVNADDPRAHPYIKHVDFPEVVTSETKTGNSVSRSTRFATSTGRIPRHPFTPLNGELSQIGTNQELVESAVCRTASGTSNQERPAHRCSAAGRGRTAGSVAHRRLRAVLGLHLE